MLQEAIKEVLDAERSRKGQKPCHVNRISAIADPCLRKLYYNRTAWDQKLPNSDRFQGILETGNEMEPVIERIVSKIGVAATPAFRIVGSQTPTKDFLLDKYNISGSIDGFLQFKINGDWKTQGVVDIKTSHPSIFLNLSDVRSLYRYSWTRKYIGQLTLYALAHNCEKWFILFVNKSNLFDLKLIECELDLEYAESLLKKAEQINAAIEEKSPPSKLNDPDVCPRCEFLSLCCPEYVSNGDLHISTDVELEAVLERLSDLDETKDEIKQLEKVRDNLLVKGADTACGQWLITWKKIITERKATEAKTITAWRKKIFHA